MLSPEVKKEILDMALSCRVEYILEKADSSYPVGESFEAGYRKCLEEIEKLEAAAQLCVVKHEEK